jgi:plasmid replication initiation protein
MIPTKENIAKFQAKRRNTLKPKVHQKIANTFIENAISKSNFSALKTLYYLSTVLSKLDMANMQDDKIIGIRIDKREMLNFTGLTADTIIKTTKQMQQTSITFIDEKDGTIEGMSLLPRYLFVPNKNIVELDLYVRIARMIIDVKKNYTNLNIKDLMLVKNAHSLRLLSLLCRMSQYDKNIPKRKRMTLDELNLFFGTNYRSWSLIEREIIKKVKEDLDNNSKISFVYESNFERLGRGRPKFRDVTIDVIQKKSVQGKLI